jgi:hypothetical protein
MHAIGQKGPRPKGPLVPYMDAFKRRSAALGYAPTTVRTDAPLISGFSKWLGRKKIPIEKISPNHVECYLRYRARRRCRRSGEVAVLRRLFDALREEGIVSEQPACRESTPAQRLLDEYACYLRQDSGKMRRRSRRSAGHSRRPCCPQPACSGTTVFQTPISCSGVSSRSPIGTAVFLLWAAERELTTRIGTQLATPMLLSGRLPESQASQAGLVLGTYRARGSNLQAPVKVETQSCWPPGAGHVRCGHLLSRPRRELHVIASIGFWISENPRKSLTPRSGTRLSSIDGQPPENRGQRNHASDVALGCPRHAPSDGLCCVRHLLARWVKTAPRRSPARALGCSAAHGHVYCQCRPAWRCRSDKRASTPS